MHLDRLWLTDFRNYRAAERRAGADGLTVITGRNGAGQDQPARGGRLPGHPALVPGRADRGAGPGRAPTGRSCGPRPSATAGRCCIEAELRPAGRDRDPGQPPAAAPGPRPARRAAGHACSPPTTWRWSRAARPSAGATSTTPLVAVHPRHDAAARRGRPDPAPAQRAAQAGRRPARPPRSPPPSTCGTPSWPTPASALADGPGRPGRPSWRPRWPTAYDRLADRAADGRRSRYQRVVAGPAWPTALAAARADDLRRGVTTVGPAPRRPGRSPSAGCRPGPTPPRASSGRWPWPCGWPAHQLVTDATGHAAGAAARRRVLRARPATAREALLAHLPAGQALLTTAGRCPPRPPDRCVARSTTVDAGCDGWAGRGAAGPTGGSAMSRGSRSASRTAPSPRPVGDVARRAWSAGSGAAGPSVLGRRVRPLGGDRRRRRWPPTSSRCRSTGRTLVVGVDHPAWATQLPLPGRARPARRRLAADRPARTPSRSGSTVKRRRRPHGLAGDRSPDGTRDLVESTRIAFRAV